MSDTNTNSAQPAAGASATAPAPDPHTLESGASPLHSELPSPTAAQVERARLEAGWKSELARLEYEIETLRTVLNAKSNQAVDLKRKLGITPITEIKQDLQQGLQTIRESDAYQKTGTAIKTFGDFASKKLSDIRNSNAFKSVEEKVGTAYQSVKSRGPSAVDGDGFSDAATGGGLTTSASLSSGVGSSTDVSSPASGTTAVTAEKPGNAVGGNAVEKPVSAAEKPGGTTTETSPPEKSGGPL